MSSDRDRECARLRNELGTALKLNGHLLSLNDQLRSERDQACALTAQRHTDLARLRQLRVRYELEDESPRFVMRVIDEFGLLGQTGNDAPLSSE